MQEDVSARPDFSPLGDSLLTPHQKTHEAASRERLLSERRELTHWLKLITAKRDLIAARVVPPLTDFEVPSGKGTLGTSEEKAGRVSELSELLDLNAPLPSTSTMRILQQCAVKASERIAELDNEIQAW